MAVSTKVGSFSKPAATGSQVITGVGFIPKAIIFWGAGSNQTSGTWDADIRSFIGFTTGAANSFCSAATSADASGTSATARRMAAKAITAVDASAALSFEADLTSLDADGFTLNWTNVTATAAEVVMYMAIGGADITNAKVVNWTTPTAVGNKAVTGVGFIPDLVLNSSALATAIPQSSGNGYLNFGAMNKHGQQWANSIVAQHNFNPSNTTRFQQTDAGYVSGEINETVFQQAHFVSMDADGFTTNFANTVGIAYNAISLCLKGVSSKIGAFAKTTAAAPAAQSITRVGFTPKAVLFSGTTAQAQGAPITQGIWEMGASDGTSSRLASLSDIDAVTPTQADSIFYNDAVLTTLAGNGAAALTKGAVTSFDADGFSLSMNPNQATASEHLYLAIGDAGVNTLPSKVG